jgi:hypothetical protein
MPVWNPKPYLLSTSALALAICASGVPAIAQTTPAGRIDAVEQQIRALQQELRQLKRDMATQSTELKRSQDQVKASQEQARQAQAAAAQAQAQTQAQAAQPQPKSLVTRTEDGSIQIGGVKLKLGGFLEAAGIYRSRNDVSDVATDFGGIPFKNSVLAHEQEFRGTARQSRISLLVGGDVDQDTHLAAYVESDFLGVGTASNSRESNSYVPRLRVAYGTVDLDRYGLHILAGQNWSLLTTNSTGIVPRTEQIPLTIDAQYVPGFNWTRNPQARIVEKFSDAVSAGVSFESPQAVFPPSPFAAPAGVNVNNPGDSAGLLNATTTYSNDIMPDVIAKVAFEPGWGHYELKGLARMFTNRTAGTTHDVWGYGGGFAAIMPVIPKLLDLQLSGLVGAGIGRYSSSQLPDVALSGSNTLVAIPEGQLLAGLVGHPWVGTDVYLYGGWEHADRAGAASTAGYGSPTLVNTGCNIEGSTVCAAETKNMWQATSGAWHDLYKGSFGRATVGLQASYTVRQAFSSVGGGPRTDEVTVMTSFRYYPY